MSGQLLKPSKASRLRRMLQAKETAFLMEAHDGISARLAQRAGFQGVWASGLTISSALGVRDANELSATQMADHVGYIANAVDIPVLVDGDTGHGNFNNARRFARSLCERGAAGLCIEDKVFPKTNSFLKDHHPLAETAEFAGKIAACKDYVADAAFALVARTETLIAGRSVDEALERADHYVRAGADAILVHSRKSTADEVLAFANCWKNRAPLVIVPTRYAGTPTEVFRRADIRLVIWANHALRAAIRAIDGLCRQVAAESSVAAIEPSIASVEDIFELLGYEELDKAEQRYFNYVPGPGHKAYRYAQAE